MSVLYRRIDEIDVNIFRRISSVSVRSRRVPINFEQVFRLRVELSGADRMVIEEIIQC